MSECKVLIVSRTCGSAVKFLGVPSSSVSIDSRQLRKEDRSPRLGGTKNSEPPMNKLIL